MSDSSSIIIAGSTGLIGHSLLSQALKNEAFEHIYSLSRKPLEEKSKKLTQLISPNLAILPDKMTASLPNVGFITLGTTLKQAGSKEALRAVDVSLVVDVAQAMSIIGVKHIYIVSCIGASNKALSHYLKYKGEMEMAVSTMNFESISFIQPGPLSGYRSKERSDEKLLQTVMQFFNPIIKGYLLNYKPIEGEVVANFMLNMALHHKNSGVHRYTSKTIFESL
ncbi:putative uncharacterized protein [Aliivibrio wodanis]|uniref:Nucleoside-diphosphate sugar epimerase n=1 Tax=Aliivibrio wodanis TaxID=80852 RepID=A0A090I597_9GAMM|nr:putative uncharacterized protein [Aliivibrio wodanis]